MKRVVYAPPRPRTAWTWGGAILVLGALTAGLLGAAIVLWRSIDIESLLESDGAPPLVLSPVPPLILPAFPETRTWPAYVYVSRISSGFYPDTAYLGRLAQRWDSLLTSAGAATVHLSAAEELASVPRRALLVIPAAVSLDATERRAIRRHVKEGGDLLATWAIGSRDASREWRGFEYLQELTGARVAGTLENRPPNYLTLPHGSVLAAGLPPGFRIELRSEPWITLRAEASDPFWSDWALNPRADWGGGPAAAAVARRTEAGGRLVWFGYRLDVAASERDRVALDRLATNGALWAAGHAVAEVEPWPGAARAALAVTQDLEHDFANSRRLANRFEALGVPVTFFVVTRLARATPELAGPLLAAGELGSHGVDHRQMAGRLAATQLAAAQQARAEIEDWAGVRPAGFRPPRELYDQATLETWRRQGGVYLAASNDARSAAPEVYDFGAGRTVVLPRVVDDDYTVMVVRGAMRSDSLESALHAALEKMRRLGGLDLVTLHSQLIDSERRLGAVESVAGAARRDGDVWIARAADIASWWLTRTDLELGVRERTDGSVLLTLRNSGSGPAGGWLRLHLPDDPASYAAPEAGMETLDARIEGDAMLIAVPALPAGEAFELLVPRRQLP